MPNKINQFVKYTGIDHFPNTNTPCFKQFNISQFFQLSTPSSPIEDLLTVNAKSYITTVQLVQTSTGHSLEGQFLTGKKALVSGSIGLDFQYAASDLSYSIHHDKHYLDFSEYITLPADYVSNIPPSPKIIIEDIYSYIVSPEYLYHNVTLLVTLPLH